MKIKFRVIIYIILITPVFSSAEIQYSHMGYFDLGTIHRLSDGSIIKLPYRMVKYEPVISFNNFNIVANTAIEFRLKDINDVFGSKLLFDLRELYLEWMAPFGDFSIGKQIISWGSANENNPTDNISPYNYYYLFSMGKERKEGILSLNSTIYLRDIKLNVVLIPQHNTNILPLNDPEFSLTSPIVPKEEQIMELVKPFEYGISMNFPFNSIEITTSYFSGYDRIVSFFGANVWSNQAFTDPIIADTVLSFRKTDMLGIGLSILSGDFTLNGDIGYFVTNDQIDNKGDLYREYDVGKQIIIDACEEKNDDLPEGWFQVDCDEEPTHKEIFLLDNYANYYQFLLEMEYTPSSNFNIIGQYAKQQTIVFGLADSLTLSNETVLLDPEKLFIPGMGSPNTFISSNSISIVVQKLFPDLGVELRFSSIFDLDEKGSLYEAGIEYEVYENTKILIAANKIIANKYIPENPFTGMEDFSHIRLELKYYY